MDLISVIIPVYNVEKYLERCLRSVINQTYKNLEIILVDDGSTDNSGNICDVYKENDNRIKVIHKTNGGLSSARNAGLDIAGGDYIGFVDSDDWIELNMYEYLYSLLQDYPSAQLSQCDSIIVKNENKKWRQPKEIIQLWNRNTMLNYFFRLSGEKSNTSVWNKLIRKSILKDFSFVYTICEDVEASYEFYKRATNMVVSNQILYHYYMCNQGITRGRFKLRDLDYLDVMDRIVEKTKKDFPQYIEHAEFYRKRANYTLFLKMVLRGFDKKNYELNHIYKRLKYEIKRDYKILLRGKMPFNRKLILIWIYIT